MSASVRIELADGIAHLVLAAPPRNELDLERLAELARAIREELPGLGARSLIIAGAGKHFSAGANVPQLEALFRADPAGAARLVAEHGAVLAAVARLPMPTAAAIGGVCLGAALELALACRFRVAARNAVLALPEASFGLMPGLGGIARLTALVGRTRALELALTGRSIGAEEALGIGLVDAIANRGALLDTAGSLVRLAAGSRAEAVPA